MLDSKSLFCSSDSLGLEGSREMCLYLARISIPKSAVEKSACAGAEAIVYLIEGFSIADVLLMGGFMVLKEENNHLTVKISC